jgi:hypothetical protein
LELSKSRFIKLFCDRLRTASKPKFGLWPVGWETLVHTLHLNIFYTANNQCNSRKNQLRLCSTGSLVLLALATKCITYNQTLKPIKFIKQQRTHVENWSIYYFISYWFMDPYHYSWLASGVSINSTVNNCVIFSLFST